MAIKKVVQRKRASGSSERINNFDVKRKEKDVHPLLAYTALALHMSFKGSNKQGTKPNNCSGSSSSEQTLLEQTLNHLLSSSSKLLGLGDTGKSNKLPRESAHTKTCVRSHGKKQNELQTDVSSPTGDALRDIEVGSFGLAKLMRDMETKELVAVKFIERGPKVNENVAREIINHKEIRHPNVVRFKEARFLSFQATITLNISWFGMFLIDDIIMLEILPF